VSENKGLVLWFVIGLALVITLGWVFTANDLALNKVFMPAQEQVRHDTFKQSQAYRDGMVTELENMQMEYVQADAAHKPALAAIILHRAASVNRADLTPELRSFLQEIQQ